MASNEKKCAVCGAKAIGTGVDPVEVKEVSMCHDCLLLSKVDVDPQEVEEMSWLLFFQD